MKRRKINTHEVKIVQKIAGDAGFNIPDDLSEFDVLELNDEGMGSIAFIREEKPYDDRRFGGEIGGLDYKDSDGIDIHMHLYIDEEGYLYELDVWKVNFEPRISYPEL